MKVGSPARLCSPSGPPRGGGGEGSSNVAPRPKQPSSLPDAPPTGFVCRCPNCKLFLSPAGRENLPWSPEPPFSFQWADAGLNGPGLWRVFSCRGPSRGLACVGGAGRPASPSNNPRVLRSVCAFAKIGHRGSTVLETSQRAGYGLVPESVLVNRAGRPGSASTAGAARRARTAGRVPGRRS